MERDFGHDIERLTNDIKSLDTANANKEYVGQFVSYLRAKGSAPNTIIKHLYCAKAFFSVLDPKADLKDATSEQIQDALGKLEVKHYSHLIYYSITFHSRTVRRNVFIPIMA